MQLSTGRMQLYSTMKTLHEQWQETKHYWSDPVSRDFDENFFMPLDLQVQSTLRGIDRLSQVMGQAKQECE